MTFWGVELWPAALLFARAGAILMLLPGFGEPAVSPRFRLAFALVFTALLAPIVAPGLPQMPASFGAAAGQIIGEVLTGVLIGASARVLAAALASAGQLIGLETGLAFAQTADPTMTQAGQLIAVFLSIMGATLVFATDLHHAFLRAVVGSYDVFAPGAAPDSGDASALVLRMVSDGFLIAAQIAAPLLLAGVVFRVGLGVLSRLIPTIQVFFVAMPVNVLGGLLIMMLVLSTGFLLWLDRLDRFATTLS